MCFIIYDALLKKPMKYIKVITFEYLLWIKCSTKP